jgi:hypothetical protein
MALQCAVPRAALSDDIDVAPEKRAQNTAMRLTATLSCSSWLAGSGLTLGRHRDSPTGLGFDLDVSMVAEPWHTAAAHALRNFPKVDDFGDVSADYVADEGKRVLKSD